MKKHQVLISVMCMLMIVFTLSSCSVAGNSGVNSDSSTVSPNGTSNNEDNAANQPKDTTVLTGDGATSGVESSEVTTLPETTVSPDVTTSPETTVPETTLPETTAPETTSPIDKNDLTWNLILVNPWNPIPDGYIESVQLVTVTGKYQVDARCADALKQMLADCRAAGHTPYICSAYRTLAVQEQLFNNMVKTYKKRGYDDESARELAAKEVAVPGTSEHHLGLAVDIPCQSYPVLDDAQANTATQKWLMANCYKYGFILRYPKGKTDITGIIYEPWHYRYVGVEIATEITERGITLEEYLGIYGAIGDQN